jgi:hypothetical protein
LRGGREKPESEGEKDHHHSQVGTAYLRKKLLEVLLIIELLWLSSFKKVEVRICMNWRRQYSNIYTSLQQTVYNRFIHILEDSISQKQHIKIRFQPLFSSSSPSPSGILEAIQRCHIAIGEP